MDIKTFEKIYQITIQMVCDYYRLARKTRLEQVKDTYYAMATGSLLTLIGVAMQIKHKRANEIIEEVESLLY